MVKNEPLFVSHLIILTMISLEAKFLCVPEAQTQAEVGDWNQRQFA